MMTDTAIWEEQRMGRCVIRVQPSAHLSIQTVDLLLIDVQLIGLDHTRRILGYKEQDG